MSFETRAQIVVGVPVDLGNFWVTTGAVPHCRKCGIDRPDLYCGFCGTTLEYRQLREPLTPLLALGREWQMDDPEKIWERLHKGEDPVKFHPVDALVDYRVEPRRLAFGKIVVQSPTMPLVPGGGTPETRSFDSYEILNAYHEIVQHARDIGLYDAPQTYLVLENTTR